MTPKHSFVAHEKIAYRWFGVLHQVLVFYHIVNRTTYPAILARQGKKRIYRCITINHLLLNYLSNM